MTRALAVLILLACLALGAAPALAQETGRITGTVRDAGSGRALPFATISIPELRKGVASDSKGEFLLTGVPVGTYTVRCQFLGYTDGAREGVVVAAGRPVKLEFALREVVVREEKEIVVTGERPLVEVNRGATVRSISSKDISAMPVQTLSDVIEKQVGVSTENEALHVRGGRSDETVFVIDGVVNRNLISGQSTAGSINARSVAEVNVVTGGFDAKYGQALSGVVDVKLKEGGDAYHGGFSMQGGRFSTSYFSGQVSGPDWLTAGLAEIGLKLPGTASFLIDVSADFTDTYLPAIGDLEGSPRLRSGYEDSFLGQKFRWGQGWMPSEDNTWRGLYKWTWRPTPADKLDVSFSKRIGFDQGFTRSPFEDISGFEIGFPWAWSRRLDHFGTVTEDNNTLQAAWTKLLGKTSFFNVQVSRYFSALTRRWTARAGPSTCSRRTRACPTASTPSTSSTPATTTAGRTTTPRPGRWAAATRPATGGGHTIEAGCAPLAERAVHHHPVSVGLRPRRARLGARPLARLPGPGNLYAAGPDRVRGLRRQPRPARRLLVPGRAGRGRGRRHQQQEHHGEHARGVLRGHPARSSAGASRGTSRRRIQVVAPDHRERTTSSSTTASSPSARPTTTSTRS